MINPARLFASVLSISALVVAIAYVAHFISMSTGGAAAVGLLLAAAPTSAIVAYMLKSNEFWSYVAHMWVLLIIYVVALYYALMLANVANGHISIDGFREYSAIYVIAAAGYLAAIALATLCVVLGRFVPDWWRSVGR